MHDLSPLTALGNTVAQSDQVAGLTITEVADLAFASVAARLSREEECRSALTDYLGDDLPQAGKALVRAPISAIWLGPEQWMLSAPFHSHETLAEDIKAVVKDTGSVTEQSDAWVAFDVEGDGVIALSERLCAAPARRMQTGDAQRTTIHHLGCFLVCLSTHQHMRFIGPRSSAASLHHALVTAAHSVA